MVTKGLFTSAVVLLTTSLSPQSKSDSGAIMYNNHAYASHHKPKTKTKRPDINYTVARVIYGEASTISSARARFLVASVIKNRIGNRDFGNLHNMYQVVTDEGAFCAYRKGQNWEDTRQPWLLRGDKKFTRVWKECMELSRGDFKSKPGVHFFVTSGKIPPANMVSDIYELVKVCSTGGLDFYTYK
jgi:hypothetical protein